MFKNDREPGAGHAGGAGCLWTGVRAVALIVFVWIQLTLVMSVGKGRDGMLLLLAYWAGASLALWLSFKLIDWIASWAFDDGGLQRDVARAFRPLAVSFFFFPLWVVWGAIPLPLAFFMRFPTGAAAPAILWISVLYVPFGALLFVLSRSLVRSLLPPGEAEATAQGRQ